MLAEHAAGQVDDLAGHLGLGAKLADHAGIIAVGDEADVLAVGLGGDGEAQLGGDFAHLRLGHAAQREAQIIELVLRGREQEIALVARRIGGAVQLGALRALDAADIMAGGEAIGAEIARERAAGR